MFCRQMILGLLRLRSLGPWQHCCQLLFIFFSLSLFNSRPHNPARLTSVAGFLPIFRALGIPKCLPYLPPVLPRLLKIAETDNLVLREYSLGQITGLCACVRGGRLCASVNCECESVSIRACGHPCMCACLSKPNGNPCSAEVRNIFNQI